MKKFLLVLLLVLCMALPASAKTFTTDANTTSKDLRDAVASADVDTIVVANNITVPALAESGYGLYMPMCKTLTLQINKGCELKVNDSDACIYGIYVSYGCNLTVVGEGSLIVNSSNDTFGIYMSGNTLNIAGGVSISANAQSQNPRTVIGVQVASGTANILSADVSASNTTGTKHSVSRSGGTLTVYAGKFSVGTAGANWQSDKDSVKDEYLGPDSTGETSGTKYVVTNHAKITFDTESLDITQGESGVVSVDFCTSGDPTPTPLSIDKLEVTPASVDGITVTPSSKDGKITFTVENTCALGTYPFNVICTAENPGNANKPHMQANTFTVTTVHDPNAAAVSFDVTSLDIGQGKSGSVDVTLHTNEQPGTNLTLTNVTVTPKDTYSGISVTSADVSTTKRTITFNVDGSCASGDYTFNVKCTGTDAQNHEYTSSADFTVTVYDPSETNSSGSVSNGSCNAGFAGLALAAFALLAAKRKK